MDLAVEAHLWEVRVVVSAAARAGSGPLAPLAGENGRFCQVHTNSTEVFLLFLQKAKEM